MRNVNDALWMWGHAAGMHNGHYNLPAASRMTPAEATIYMGLGNLMMINIGDVPAPPFDQYMISFRPLRRVVWSGVGDSSSSRNDMEAVLSLVPKFPNLTGAIMDDFFHASNEAGSYSRYTPTEIAGFRRRLRSGVRPLELYVVTYAHDLANPIADHLAECDAITFWTWHGRDLVDLEANFARLCELAPRQRKLLGCYMWDYGSSQPMTIDLMRHQCTLGLQWLKSGAIDGMIFLASGACDLDLETVEWTRQWIATNGDELLA